MVSERKVAEALEAAGFPESQVEALMEAFTLHHHTHTMDEVIGLDEHLEDLEADDDETADDEEG